MLDPTADLGSPPRLQGSWILGLIGGVALTGGLLWLVFPLTIQMALGFRSGGWALWWPTIGLVASGAALAAIVIWRQMPWLVTGVPAAVILVSYGLALSGVEQPVWLVGITDSWLPETLGPTPFLVAGILLCRTISAAAEVSKP